VSIRLSDDAQDPQQPRNGCLVLVHPLMRVEFESMAEPDDPRFGNDTVAFMDDVEFVAFDLETTGLSSAFCHIIEFGAVRFRADGTELDRLEQLVNPGCPIPPRVTAVHGITDEMVQGHPRIKQALPEFLQFLGDDGTIVLAHNAAFDLGFISMSAARTQMDVPQHSVVDTLALSRKRLRRMPNHRLETIGRHFQVVDSTEHRGLGDALVVKSVFLYLLEQHPAICGIDDLMNVVSPMFFEPACLDPVLFPVGYEPLAQAIEAGESLSIVYGGGSKGAGSRQITPHTLIEERGTFYLIARCHIDDTDKHFRLDRIREIQSD